MGKKATQPSITGNQAAQNLGLTLDPRNNLYYNSEGNYFSAPEYQSPQALQWQGGMGYAGNPLGGYSLKSKELTKGALSNNNYVFNPFTGEAVGVSAGQRSMIDAMLAAQKPYQAPVSLEALFPTMSLKQTSPISSTGIYGAGRFLTPSQAQATGGVLGNK